MRFLGHVRSKIKVHSHQQNHGAIRRLLLHEMVARVLKASIYKILREANGFGGNDGLLVALKDQLGVGSDNRPWQVSMLDQTHTHTHTHTCMLHRQTGRQTDTKSHSKTGAHTKTAYACMHTYTGMNACTCLCMNASIGIHTHRIHQNQSVFQHG